MERAGSRGGARTWTAMARSYARGEGVAAPAFGLRAPDQVVDAAEPRVPDAKADSVRPIKASGEDGTLAANVTWGATFWAAAAQRDRENFRSTFCGAIGLDMTWDTAAPALSGPILPPGGCSWDGRKGFA